MAKSKSKRVTKLAPKSAQAIVKQERPKLPSLPERIETLLMEGDLTGLSVPERLAFYKAVCRSLGLNPLTRPFEYIVFTDREEGEEGTPKPKGKMVLYARADCAAQLRKIHKVGIEQSMKRWREGEFYYAEANAFILERAGKRTDSGLGVVWLKKWDRKTTSYKELAGRDLANAMMKAETKAKRRATFSICGLHILDESEIEDLTSMTFEVSESGRVVEIAPSIEPAALPEFNANEQRFLNRLTPEQREVEQAQIRKMQQKDSPQHGPSPAPTVGRAQSADTQPTSPSAAREDAAKAPTMTPTASSYDGVTFRLLPSGMYAIDGPKNLLHEHRELLKTYWNRVAKILACTPEETGRLLSRFEQLKVKARMVSDGE